MSKEDFWVKLGNCTEIIDMASTPARLYILISQIQLALRHPNNVGTSAEIAREIALNMTEAVCHYVPEARESIEQGWNPAYDVKQDYFEAEF
ncbi:MAG: hypothetical protein ACRCYQ_07240 [Nocardioides sp.]